MNVFFMDFDPIPSAVWARDLYDQLQIRSDFRKWFPRMCQYGFVEGRDYEYMPRVRRQDEGGRTVERYVKDYRITLEMAKQLYKLHHFHKNGCFHPYTEPHCRETDHWMQAIIELLHQHKCKNHAPPKHFFEPPSRDSDSLVTTTRNSENVYMLSMIDEYDLQEFLTDEERNKKEEETPAVVLPETTPEPETDVEVEEPEKDDGKLTKLLAIVFVLGVGGAGAFFYFYIYKPKQSEPEVSKENLEYENLPTKNEDEDSE